MIAHPPFRNPAAGAAQRKRGAELFCHYHLATARAFSEFADSGHREDMRAWSQLSDRKTRFVDGRNSFPERWLAPVVDLLINVVAGNAFRDWIRIPKEFLGDGSRDSGPSASLMGRWFGSDKRRRFG